MTRFTFEQRICQNCKQQTLLPQKLHIESCPSEILKRISSALNQTNLSRTEQAIIKCMMKQEISTQQIYNHSDSGEEEENDSLEDAPQQYVQFQPDDQIQYLDVMGADQLSNVLLINQESQSIKRMRNLFQDVNIQELKHLTRSQAKKQKLSYQQVQPPRQKELIQVKCTSNKTRVPRSVCMVCHLSFDNTAKLRKHESTTVHQIAAFKNSIKYHEKELSDSQIDQFILQ